HGLLHLEAARSWNTRAGRLRAFARIDKLLDRDHVGSVIVNEGNRRCYEPGRDRAWTVVLHWTGSRASPPAPRPAPGPARQRRARQTVATTESTTGPNQAR